VSGDHLTTASGRYRGLIGLFLAALALRLAYLLTRWGEPLVDNSDPYYFSLIAQHLVEGRGFLEIKAWAYRPPGFPFLLAAVYWPAGVNVDLGRVALAVLGAAHCVFQVLWVRRLAGDRVGLWAGWLTAVYPQLVRYPQEMYSEPLYLFWLSGALALLLAGLERGDGRRVAAAGVGFGLAALTREAGLLTPFILGLWLMLARRQLPPRLGRWWLLLTALTALTVLPWTVRNKLVLGAFVPIATNSGINFYMGNNPEATGDFGWAVAPGVDWDDGGNEVLASREGFKAGLAWIRANPARAATLWAKKVWILWRPPLYGFGGLGKAALAMRAVWLVCYLAAGLLAAAAWRELREDWPRTALPLLFMVICSLPHVVTYASTRYRLTMEAFLFVYSAYGAATLRRPRAEEDA